MTPYPPPSTPNGQGSPRGRALRFLLSRLIWLCVLPLLLMGAFIAVIQVRHLMDERAQDAQERASQVTRQVDRYLREQIAVLQMMASSPLLDDPPRLKDFYKASLNFRDKFEGEVILADLSSQMIMNTRLPLGAALPKLPVPRGHAAVPQVLATGSPAVGDMFLGPIAQEPLVAVVVPVVRDAQTRLLLLSSIPTRKIKERVNELHLPTGWFISLLDSKKDELASWGEAVPEPWQGQPSPRFMANASLAPWTLTLDISSWEYYGPIIYTGAALLTAILLATLISLLGGRLSGGRLADAVASLALSKGQRITGSLVAEIEAVRDILEEAAQARQAAEATTHESDRRFRQLFQAATVPLVFVDAQGRIIELNERFTQTFGYTHEDVPTVEHWWRLAYPDPAYRAWVVQTWQDALSEASRGNDDITPHEYRVTCKNGQERIMVISGITLGEDFLATFIDVTERKQAEEEKALTAEVLGLVNSASDRCALLTAVLARLQAWSGCQAVGIRLRQGDDYPYFETSGFPADFVRLENSLCVRGRDGEILRDAQQKPVLECMCGNILQGRFDPALPFFTNGGSFWSNCTTELLATTTDADRQARTRNRCNGAGYESVALIPLRAGGVAFGLIQLNDKRPGRFTPEKIALVERLAENVAVFLAKLEAQEEQEMLFKQRQLVLDAARMGWWRYDIRSKRSSWDQRYAQIFQVSGLEGPNELVLSRLHPEDLPKVWAAVEAALDPARPLPYFAEYRLNLPDGSQRWVEAHGMAVFGGEGQGRRASALLGTVADITPRKQAEMELRQSQASLRGLLDATTDVVLLLDRDYKVVAANEVAAARLGHTPQSLKGQSILDYLVPEVAQGRRERFEEALSTGRPLRFQDSREGRHFDNHFYPVSDGQGRIGGIAIYARDITQAVEDEQRRAALEKQLIQAQKMEAVGTLAGGIAHDFNNILGVIVGYSEMALDDARRGQPAPDDLEQVLEAAERAKGLVRQILTFSRKVEVEMMPMDLNKEAAQAAQLLGKTIPKMIRIETDLAPDLQTINANANQMEQILLNLGTNAAHAMPEGGLLRIKTENMMMDERACATCGRLQAGPYVALIVSDTGQGMDQETQEHIFEPFFTTKGPGKGTGLGLSTVHGIVTGHSGHITCQSAPGQGTAFTIYLPVLSQQPVGPAPALAPAELPGGRERVLLVDDEEALLQMGYRFLTQAGYAVWTATSGEQALSTCRSLDPKPDLVVMDLGMPGMGGRKALQEMLAGDPQVKIVVASGYAADTQVQEALENGARDFVAKPYRRTELLTTVRRVLDAPSGPAA